MAAEDELSLNETTPKPAEEDHDEIEGTAQTEAAPTVQDFDLAAWIEGATPMRRAITIYSDLGAHAEVDLLEARILEAEHGNAMPEEIRRLKEEKSQAMRRVKDSALDIVMEAWPPGKARTFLQALSKKLSDEEKGRQLLAAQIVQPPGVTATFIKQLEEHLPTEYAGILVRYAEMQRDSGAISAPFSQES